MNGEGDGEGSTNAADNMQNTKPGEGLKEVAKSRRTDFELEEIKPGGRSLSQIRSELDRQLQAKELDGYLLLPGDVLHDGKSQFFGRNAGAVFTRDLLQKALSR